MATDIEWLTPAQRSEWDEFVRRTPQGSIFATTAFLNALGAAYELAVTRKDASISAGIPLVRGMLGTHSNPLYCKYLGFQALAPESNKTSAITGRLAEQVGDFEPLLRSLHSFDYNFHPTFTNWMPFYWLGFRQQTNYTYVIRNHNASLWWTSADERLRRSVRRGEQNAVSIERLDSPTAEMLRACYEICMQPYTSRNTRPLMTYERFVQFAKELCGNGGARVWLARDKSGKDAAAALVLYDWRSAYFLMNGTLADAPAGTNSALLFDVIEHALGQGLDFDFEGSMIKPIEHYYRKFGAELVPYFQIWKPTALTSALRMGKAIGRRVLGYSR